MAPLGLATLTPPLPDGELTVSDPLATAMVRPPVVKSATFTLLHVTLTTLEPDEKRPVFVAPMPSDGEAALPADRTRLVRPAVVVLALMTFVPSLKSTAFWPVGIDTVVPAPGFFTRKLKAPDVWLET